MSVRKSERSQGKLQVLNLAKYCCTYTLSLCRNERVFPKSQRWLITSKVANEAVEALTCIRRANSVLITPGPNMEEEYQYRSMQQLEAHAHLEALLSLIDISFALNNIAPDRIQFWTKLIVDTDEKLRAWTRSDKERYLKLMNR